MDFDRIKRLPYMSKRMYVISSICRQRSVDLQYMFGLFNLYNRKNSGRWFWQKASFTGALKESYDTFNKIVDNIVKQMKDIDKDRFDSLVRDAAEPLDRLLTGMELNCEVSRENDFEYVTGFLDENLSRLINDSLKPIRQGEKN